MHICQLPKTIDAGPQGVWAAGTYAMEDKNLAELILMYPDAGWRANKMPDYRPDLANCDSVLVAGGLGLGDAIMLTPVLRALKALGKEVRVACFAHYQQALLNLPYVDGFEQWPLFWDGPGDFAKHNPIFLENFLLHPKARTHHLTDVFADICGVTITEDKVNPWGKSADYFPLESERAFVTREFPRVAGRKRLAMQVQASARCRTYPATQLRDVMQLMIRDGWEVYLMGAPGEFDCKEVGHLHDLRVKAPGFRESAAFLETCDAFVGPDSGFLHAAGALGVPSVGLFGAFQWPTRTAYYKNTFAIQGMGECSPCFHSPTKLQPMFPAGKPCSYSGKCEVLAEISAERVVAKIHQVAR